MTSFSFFKYFDAFELDVNIANFVYYGKTRLCSLVSSLFVSSTIAINCPLICNNNNNNNVYSD